MLRKRKGTDGSGGNWRRRREVGKREHDDETRKAGAARRGLLGARIKEGVGNSAAGRRRQKNDFSKLIGISKGREEGNWEETRVGSNRENEREKKQGQLRSHRRKITSQTPNTSKSLD